MIFPLFYLLSSVALIVTMFLFPKSQEKQNAVVWGIVCITAYECYTALIAGLFSLVRIPVNIVSIAIVNLVVAFILGLLIHRQKNRQRYGIKYIDIAFTVLLAVFAIFVFVFRFGADAAIIYATIDPADKFSQAMHVISKGSVIYTYPNMYFGNITSALFMQMAEPVFPGILLFRAMEIKELINLWMAGMLFYAALRGYSNRGFSCAIFFVLAFLYVLGYPWSNELWGFGYLGIAVSLVIFVQIGAKLLLSETVRPVFALIVVALGCLGVGISYTLFAPPVYIAAFCVITLYIVRGRRREQIVPLLFKRLIPIQFAVFSVPALITVIYTMFLDRDGSISIGTQLTAEGAIFRNLFTDFLPYLPFALFTLVFAIAKKQWDFSTFFAIIFAAFQLYFLMRMVSGDVSTYYYYKLNFVTWFIVLFLAGIAIDALTADRKRMVFAVCYLTCWGLTAFAGLLGYDARLHEKNPFINPVAGMSVPFQIYANNLMYFKDIGNNIIYYDWNFVELCDHARALKGDSVYTGYYENRVEAITDRFQDAYWIDALVNEHIETHEIIIGQLPESDADIWVVIKGSALYDSNRDYIDSLHRVYENAVGFVVQLQ